MTSISQAFTATGYSASLYLADSWTAAYTITGTFVATLRLERTRNGGQSWEVVASYTGTQTSTLLLEPGTYRWHCTAYTSGTATATLADRNDLIFPAQLVRAPDGTVVFAGNDLGTQAERIQLANDVWIVTNVGSPTSGASGTGAGVYGPGSILMDSSNKIGYLNTNTKASPTWSTFASGGGNITAVTASGGLASSGGNAPDISIVNANLIELRDTGNISGSAGSTVNFSGSLVGDVTGTQGATIVSLVGAQPAATVAAGAVLANAATNANDPSTIVKRDGSGDFTAGTITAALSGNATTATSFTGSLSGDVTGTQAATVVSLVGGQTAADVAAGAVLANGSVSAATASTIIRRDASGRAQVVDPVSAQDIASKAYVDAVAVGLTVHPAVLNASTGNLTLSGEQTIDGVLTSTSRILVKDQSAPAENGIYVTAGGAWARATDMDTWAEVPGSFVFVVSGTVNAASGWACTAGPGGTIDVTAMPWAQFSQAGVYLAGTGLDLTGNTFSVLYGTTSGTAAQGNDSRITGAAQKSANLSDLANVATAVDNLGGAASTGSGGLVRTTSPTLVTPNIGTATGSVSGNAGSATILQTTRTINGVNFNGSANITVTAAGSTLSDAVPLTGLAAQAAHTFVANATGGSAAPTAISLTTAAAELADWNGNVFKNFICDVVADTNTARTSSAADRGRVLTMSNAAAITLTLDAQAEVGFCVTVYQKGAGLVSFAAESGATIHNRQSHTKMAGQYAVCTLFVEANAGGSAAIWVLAGDTGA